MKFFSRLQKSSFGTISRPPLILIAVCLALSMWYFVVKHETSEMEIQLLINYKGQPKELYITDGIIYTVRERVRGPKLLLDTLPKSYPLPIDISRLKVGDGYTNNFSVIDEQKKLVSSLQSRAFKVIDIDQPIIKLHAEYMDRISIPLSFRYRSDNDLIVVTHRVSQNSVAFNGPENEIRELKKLEKLPIDVRVDLLDVGKGIVEKDIPIIIPVTTCPHVTSDPSSVRVFYEVKGERLEVVRPYDITLAVTNPTLYEVVPSSITLRLKVPANKQRDSQYLKELRVTALPPDMQEGESSKVHIIFTPPEGMEVMDSNKWVTITRLPEKRVKERLGPPLLQSNEQDALKNEKKADTHSQNSPTSKKETNRTKTQTKHQQKNTKRGKEASKDQKPKTPQEKKQ
ncbi:MAG: hypothetical protein J5803_00300 [Desulfovibrio sp.]|nr:hypothetical protein [Desulfovibrio sp.]